MALTNTGISKAKPGKKPSKMYDARGLFLLVNPNGSKWWRFKYRFNGKEKLLSLGVYPEVTLKRARDTRDEARERVARGIDPSAHRKAQRAAGRERAKYSFEAIAREWFAKFSTNWAKSHSDRIIRRLERDLFPWLGDRPISGITSPELLAVLRQIEDRGAMDTVHRAKQNCGQIFRYAIATGRAERNPAADLRGAFPAPQKRHFASITDADGVGELLRAIDGYQGSPTTKAALRLAPLTFVRPGELRHAEWAEIDVGKAEWRIPGAKMKGKLEHIVPLSRQAVEALREIEPITGSGPYAFPSVRTQTRPMSDNTLNAALRRLGYSSDQMTGHGFRTMASTMLNENGWNPDAIERQLAHVERNEVRGAYNRGKYLGERRKMMQWWADHLDSLRCINVATRL